jgi:CelD/BcsL family acetyltransferase involved in cellulose biosynthesis
MVEINVTIRPAGADLAGSWADLASRAAPNVFYHPAALAAIAATGFAKVHLLLGWDRSTSPARLVGLWALREKSLAAFLPTVLTAPAYDFAFLSSPMLDPHYARAVIPAFLDAIRDAAALPKVLRLNYLDGDDATYAALLQALEARGGEALPLSERGRPFASKEGGQKLAGSTRKKLRQDWNRLCAQGTVDIVELRDPAQTRAAFETFLAMEMESWKGRQGTALLNSRKDADFARALIGNLAGAGNASVASLRLDARPVAAQVLLYCGRTAYTWKTAFDEDYGRYSPGALLVDKLTERLLTSGEIDAIDSCSPEGGFMTQLWSGRRRTVDLLATVAPRRSPAFALTAVYERGYRELKRQRDNLRALAPLAGKSPAAPRNPAAPST